MVAGIVLDRSPPACSASSNCSSSGRASCRPPPLHSPSSGHAVRACVPVVGSIPPCSWPATSGASTCASSISDPCGRRRSRSPRTCAATLCRRTRPAFRSRRWRSGGFTSTGYQLMASGRGIVRLGPLVVENRDPLGMARASTTAPRRRRGVRRAAFVSARHAPTRPGPPRRPAPRDGATSRSGRLPRLARIRRR